MNKRFEDIIPGLWNENNAALRETRDVVLGGMTPIEAKIVEDANKAVALELGALIGRTADGVSPSEGLQIVVLKRAIDSAYETASILKRIMIQMTFVDLIENDGKAGFTPGCDCVVCDLAHAINASLDAAELRAKQENRHER